MDVWHFFLAFLGQRQCYQRWKFWFLLAFLSKTINGESFGFYWHFCRSHQRWKCWSFWPRLVLLATLIMNTNGESYVIWSLPLSNLWHPAPPHASSRSPESISGNLLWKQELFFLIRWAWEHLLNFTKTRARV